MSKRILVVEDQPDNRQIIRDSHVLCAQRRRTEGASGHVPKPYSPRELLSKIRQYLQ